MLLLNIPIAIRDLNRGIKTMFRIVISEGTTEVVRVNLRGINRMFWIGISERTEAEHNRTLGETLGNIVCIQNDDDDM